MEKAALSLGLILLIVGGIVFAAGFVNSQSGETVGGQIGRSVSGTQQQNYETYEIMQWGGGLAAVVGIVIAIAAAIGTDRTTKHYT